MIPKKINFPDVRTDVVPLDGGLNEAVSSLEMKPGELISCKNYYITEGSTGGYVSIAGYEVYDGQPKPSGIAGTLADHAAREAARALIDEVPGTGDVRGIHIYGGKVYAFRNAADNLSAGMFVSSNTGWDEIDTGTVTLPPGGTYEFLNYNFDATSASELMMWVDGVDHLKTFNGTTVTESINAGMGADDKPTHLAVWQQRVFVSYAGGSLQYATSGDPEDWTTDAGEIGVGYDITGLEGSVDDTLIIFGYTHTKVLKGASEDEWFLNEFSNAVGAYPRTISKLFDTLIMFNDMGVTTLAGAQEFGDFASNSIAEKIKKSLLARKSIITCATTAKSLNQYRLFFSDGTGLVFSFFNKKIRGVTALKFTHPVKIVTEGRDTAGNPVIFFAGTDGFVYQMDSGTSFNGAAIPTRMKTTYYHYKSPRNWKRFNRVTYEIACETPLEILTRPYLDYDGSGFARAISTDIDLIGQGGIWGEDLWGSMLFNGSGYNNRTFYDFMAIGSNLSMAISTNDAYSSQHTIQNFITDYVILGRQM